MTKTSNKLVWISGGVLLLAVAAILFFRSDYFVRSAKSEASPARQSFQILTADNKSNQGETIQLYVISGEGDLGAKVGENLAYASGYAHIQTLPLDEDEIDEIEPSPYNAIFVSGDHLQDLSVEKLSRFVEEGGRLFVANSFYYQDEWLDLLGISEMGEFITAKGLTFEKSLFPGYPEVPVDSNLFTHSSVQVELDETTTDLWMSAQSNPVFWTNDFGEGKAAVWNTAVLNEKSARGLMVQSVGLLFPSFVSAQVGTEIVYIDDFPSPVPEGSLSGTSLIDEEISVRDFYKHYWWRDIEKMIEKYGIKITSGTIATYENNVNPPFKEMTEAVRRPYIYYGRTLLGHKGEIGYHGYNHQPLVTAGTYIDPELGYVPWPDQQSMGEAVKKLKETVAHFFPNEKIETYVPPSNIIDREGIDVLVKELPELKTIASLYTGSESNGSFIQEFEYDETYPELYHYPRVTSGYSLDNSATFTMADAMAHIGTISHFIHPDDVLDPFRSKNSSWAKMAFKYERLLQDVRKWYPFLTSVTQREATAAIKAYQKSKITRTYTDESIFISYDKVPSTTSLLVRVEEGKELEEGTFSYGKVIKLSEGLYNVQLKEAEAEINIMEVQS
ncbi:DUF2194 domain-containing protein [Domibacillus iocasae]|uniref:DUF2194 domain-containing protein n=1 Tax=Domibacillus iocasae TaxID=1714016 RepID=A0A1E7DNI8_9BACI|nr:DUF2194 domain-containing protein [Domibacillus iocasae]OES44565.1 hypothetical protein BA724_09850 [Domibacillus iocasae]